MITRSGALLAAAALAGACHGSVAGPARPRVTLDAAIPLATLDHGATSLGALAHRVTVLTVWSVPQLRVTDAA